MKKTLIQTLHKSFEENAQTEDGIEFWYARDLQTLLDYTDWRNFLLVIDKAKNACENAKVEVEYQFVDVNRLITHGKGGKREIQDIKLTRYACYLIAQNGDPRKEVIAFAQTYFAVQTRKQEVLEERLRELKRIEKRELLAEREKRLAGIVFERGVDSHGFARIKSKGDQALFGGYSTKEMKSRLEIPEKRPLADFLPAVTLTAKALADEITEHNLLEKDLKGEVRITEEHKGSNTAVRDALLKRGIEPESLPPAEDIKKVASRHKREVKKLPGSSRKLRK
jgi:DNA-damage-inducible protein D